MMIFFKNLSTLPELAMLKTFSPDHEHPLLNLIRQQYCRSSG